MDLFDRERYFSSCVPVKALDSPLLRFSATAIAAKQLGRVSGGNFKSNGKNPTPSIMQTFRNVSQTGWLYKAASYYDRAISYLQLYLRQALPRQETDSANDISPTNLPGPDSATVGVRESFHISIAHETRDISARPFSQPMLDDLLAATSILSIYELLDHPGTEWSR
jgi:hypothetical protein